MSDPGYVNDHQSMNLVECSLKHDEWELEPKDLVLDREISHGFFATVYKGTLTRFVEYDRIDQDIPQVVRGGVPVAVKMLRGGYIMYVPRTVNFNLLKACNFISSLKYQV